MNLETQDETFEDSDLKGFYPINLQDLGTDNDIVINQAASRLGYDVRRVIGVDADPKIISVRSRYLDDYQDGVNTPELFKNAMKAKIVEIQNEAKNNEK